MRVQCPIVVMRSVSHHVYLLVPQISTMQYITYCWFHWRVTTNVNRRVENGSWVLGDGRRARPHKLLGKRTELPMQPGSEPGPCTKWFSAFWRSGRLSGDAHSAVHYFGLTYKYLFPLDVWKTTHWYFVWAYSAQCIMGHDDRSLLLTPSDYQKSWTMIMPPLGWLLWALLSTEAVEWLSKVYVPLYTELFISETFLFRQTVRPIGLSRP